MTQKRPPVSRPETLMSKRPFRNRIGAEKRSSPARTTKPLSTAPSASRSTKPGSAPVGARELSFTRIHECPGTFLQPAASRWAGRAARSASRSRMHRDDRLLGAHPPPGPSQLGSLIRGVLGTEPPARGPAGVPNGFGGRTLPCASVRECTLRTRLGDLVMKGLRYSPPSRSRSVSV